MCLREKEGNLFRYWSFDCYVVVEGLQKLEQYNTLPNQPSMEELKSLVNNLKQKITSPTEKLHIYVETLVEFYESEDPGKKTRLESLEIGPPALIRPALDSDTFKKMHRDFYAIKLNEEAFKMHEILAGYKKLYRKMENEDRKCIISFNGISRVAQEILRKVSMIS